MRAREIIFTFAPRIGEMAEWSIVAVSKTVEPQGSGGSNPSLSASLTDSFKKSCRDLQDFSFSDVIVLWPEKYRLVDPQVSIQYKWIRERGIVSIPIIVVSPGSDYCIGMLVRFFVVFGKIRRGNYIDIKFQEVHAVVFKVPE